MRIERPTVETTDSGHTRITGHDAVGTMRCSIEPLRGQEALLARQVNAETTHRIRAWWKAACGIKTSDRLVMCRDTTRVFDIESVINVDEAGRVAEISAVERSPDR